MFEGKYLLKMGESLTGMGENLQIRVDFISRETVTLNIITPEGEMLNYVTAGKIQQMNINPITRDQVFDCLASQNLNVMERSFLRDLAGKPDGTRLSEKQTVWFNKIAQKASAKHDKTRRRRTA